MGLTEKLTDIKSQTDALISYANETTGADDTRLGDAIQSLVDGFGQGGGSSFEQNSELIFEDTFEIQEDITSGTVSNLFSTQNIKVEAGVILLCEIYLIDTSFVEAINHVNFKKSKSLAMSLNGNYGGNSTPIVYSFNGISHSDSGVGLSVAYIRNTSDAYGLSVKAYVPNLVWIVAKGTYGIKIYKKSIRYD